MTSIGDLYQTEQTQANYDHHHPTAAAMTDHIIANLVMESLKIRQFGWYITGENVLADQKFLSNIHTVAEQQIDSLGQAVLAEGGKPASALAELSEYAMVETHGEDKYLAVQAMFEQLVADVQTQLMFIDRGVKLAQRDEQPLLEHTLVTVQRQLISTRQQLQARLGRWGLAGLVGDEDEDDDHE